MKGSPSRSSNRLPAVLLLAIAVFGPPSVATLAFAHAVTQNPLLTALLVLLYEVIVFAITIVGKIWQKLEDPWIDLIANWLDLEIRGILSNYTKYYYQRLTYQHRDFDLKGLSTQGVYTLSLEQVFVELSIDPKPAHQASANPLKVPEDLQVGGHSIVDFLTSEHLAAQHLVIIGAPGSGKTTLLKHTSLSLVNWRTRRHIKIKHKFPFLLSLRDHVAVIKNNSTFTLVDVVENYLTTWEHPVPTGWVKRHLMRGSCLILLDGLDEVADPDVRRQMVDWVQQQIIVYGDNRFVITSRPFGYRSTPLSGVMVLEVSPFTSQQIKSFVHNWYLANEKMSSQQNDLGVQLKAKEGAEDLLRRLRNTPALLALAVNPLLLTMIATVHRYRSTLPGKRVALYDEICEVFLGKRQEARGITLELTASQKRQVLQPLAYHVMDKGIRDIPLTEAYRIISNPLSLVSSEMHPKMFLELIENSSGLFLEREHDIYGFAHLTFQEYLAATYAKEENLEHQLMNKVELSWWHETIRLYCAQADATSIITACIVNDRPSVPVLTLALECQQEALKVQPSTRVQFDALLKKGVEDTDPDRRRLIANALLNRRLREMVYVKENIYIDNSFVTCAEYQVFLDEQRVHGAYYQPDHWESGSFNPSQGGTPVLGVRSSDALKFCHWLTERDSDPWRYRLPKKDELEKREGDMSVTVKLAEGAGYWTDNGDKFTWISRMFIPPDTMNKMIYDLFIRDVTMVRTADHTRMLNFARAFGLGHAFVKALELDRDLSISHDLASDYTFASNFVLALASDYTLDLNRNFARALKSIPNPTPDIVRAIALDEALALDHAISLICRRSYITRPNSSGGSQLSSKEEKAFLRWFIRFSAQILAFHLCYFATSSWLKYGGDPHIHTARFFDLSSSKSQDNEAFGYSIRSYLDIYTAFVLLEERIYGKPPPHEGILLVKERKNEI